MHGMYAKIKLTNINKYLNNHLSVLFYVRNFSFLTEAPFFHRQFVWMLQISAKRLSH